MFLLAADEDFNNVIIHGLLRRLPDLDLRRIQEVGLRTKDDPTILEWAAHEKRVLLTHDSQTMITHARRRIMARAPMAGLFVVSQKTSVKAALEAIALVVECSQSEEWQGQIQFLPL